MSQIINNNLSNLSIFSPDISVYSLSTLNNVSKSYNKKSKIYRGPTISAYNRQNLGTIPSNIENILYMKKDGDIVRYSFNINDSFNKNNNSNNNDNNMSKISDSSFKNKSIQSQKLNNIKKNNIIYSERFFDEKLENSKYSPGPGEYSNSSINSSFNTNNFRYNNLFSYGREEIPIQKSNNFDNGPAKYLSNYYDISNQNNKSNIYISPYERFKNKKKAEYEYKIGPGSYNYKNDQMSIIKNKNNKSPAFCVSLNDIKKPDLEEKVLNVKKNNNFQIPGPGTYNLRYPVLKKNFNCLDDKIKKNEISEFKNKIENQNQNQDFNNEDYLNKLKNIENKDKPITNKFSKIKGAVIEKQIPRFSNVGEFKSYNPGPCYYDPKIQGGIQMFNINMNKKWI
jgi:hypothetical protein